MDVELWQRAVELFHVVLDRPEDEQAAFVDAGSKGDACLRDEVLKMLSEDRRGFSRVVRGVAEVVGDLAGASDLAGETGPFAPPLTMGPYQQVGFLGRGGMGAVWRYRRVDTLQPMAIKFLLLRGDVPQVRRRRFAQEIHTLARLRHPGIVAFHDAGWLEDGTPWFAMECVEELTPGARFTDLCRQPGHPLRQQLRLFRVVCEAVLYAHRQGVIHRDLKPSNILIDHEGLPRIVDFGIARKLEEAGNEQDATSPTQRFMSPDYAPPEWRREGRVGVYTDVYSLGVVLYEMLAGQHPYRRARDGNRQIGEEHLDRLPVRPSAVFRRNASGAQEMHLSRSDWNDLDKLCLTAMHPDAAQRYPSVESLLRDIDHYLNDEPLESQPGLLRHRAAKFARRHRRGLNATAAGLALLAATIVGFTWRLARERNLAQAEATRTRHIQEFMTSLLQGGDKEAGPAADLRVSAMIDRGVQQASSFSEDPRLQADLYQTLGTMAQKLGHPDQAQVLLQKALDEHQSLSPPDPASIASDRVTLGLILADTGKATQGEQMVRQALAEVAAFGPANDRINRTLLGEVQLALGTAMIKAGEQKDAVPELQQAVNTLRSPPGGKSAPELGRALATLGDAEVYLGNYTDAETFDRQALAADLANYGDAHPRTAEDLGDIAQTEEIRGHYTDAEPLERQGLTIMQRWYGPDHPETARKMITLGSTLVYEKKEAEADDLLGRALAIQQRVYGPQHPSVAYALNSMGSAAIYEKRYEDAEKDYERVASIYRQAYGDADYRVAVALGNLASVYQAEKRYSESERVLRDVVGRFSRALGAGNIQTAMAQVRLGRTLLHENKYAEAERYSLVGYKILSKQTSSSTSYVSGARQDLVADYMALGQPEKARLFADRSSTITQ